MLNEAPQTKSSNTDKPKSIFKSFSSKLFGYDFFISFKLGSPPIGAQSYASDLARRLREQDFSVFFSEEEALLGQDLDSSIIKALHRSQILIVVTNEGALLHSTYIRKEINEFRSKNPKRLIIPININLAIEKYGNQTNISDWLADIKRTWQDETANALSDGIVSQEVLDRIALSPKFIRANKLFRWMTWAIILMLIGTSFAAIYKALEAEKNFQDADRKFRVVTSLKVISQSKGMSTGNVAGSDVLANLMLIAAAKIDSNSEVESAVIEGLENSVDTIRIYEYSSDVPNKVIFSPDSKSFVVSVGDEETSQLINSETGELIGPQISANKVVFSPDGSQILFSQEENLLHLVDTKMGLPIQPTFIGHENTIVSFAFNTNGTQIVSTDGVTIRLWDVNNHQSLGDPISNDEEGGHSDYKVDFSPDSSEIISINNRNFRLWDVKTRKLKGKSVDEIPSSIDEITTIKFCAGGERIVLGEGKTELMWNKKTGRLIKPFQLDKDNIRFLSISPDCTRFAFSGFDGNLQLWETGKNRQAPKIIDKLEETDDLDFFPLLFSPDNNILLVGSGYLDHFVDPDENGLRYGTMHLWDAKAGKRIARPLLGHTENVTSVYFSQDNKYIVSASLDNTIRNWDAESGKSIGSPFLANSGGIHELIVEPDGKRIVLLGKDSSLQLLNWNYRFDHNLHRPIGRTLKNFTLPRYGDLKISPDGTSMLTFSIDGTLRLSNNLTGDSINLKKYNLFYSAFSADSAILLICSENILEVFDAKTGKQIGDPIYGPQKFITSVAFSYDGLSIATGGSDGTLLFWDLKNRIPVGKPVKGHTNAISSIDFNKAGTQVITGSEDSSIRLWNIKTRQPIKNPYFGHQGKITSLKFSPNGKRIVSASSGSNSGSGGEIRLWDPTRCDGCDILINTDSSILSVNFSPDGASVVSLGNEFRFWDSKTGLPIGKALNDGNTPPTGTNVVFSPDGNEVFYATYVGGLSIPTPKVWLDELCNKLPRNMSDKEWNDWVSPDIQYIEQCPGKPKPQDEPS